MENRNRTFHEMNLFQGNWNNNSLDSRGPRNELERERAFEEIEKDLAGNINKLGSKAKSSGRPLILSPPVIKSVEEKPLASRREFTKDEEEEESSDSMETGGDEGEHKEEETQEGFDESFSEIMYEESSGFPYEEESANQLSAIEESSDEPHYYENPEESVDLQYESSESPPEPMQLATAYSGKNNKAEMTKVRLPLHLADVELEIDIFDAFSLSRQISAVSKVECSLQAMDAEVLLPSASLFTKGILLVNIDYVSADKTGTMHSLKLHIPWKKIIPVKWIHQPELSFKDSKEYLFASNLGKEEGYTREYCEKLAEKVNHSLSSLYCVWNEQFIQSDKVMIQGTARMKIDLFQKQNLDLQKLLSL